MTTFNRVKNILIDQLDVEESDVTMDSKIIVDLGADSLDAVELIMAFEEEFNVELDDCNSGDLLDGKTVGDIVRMIDKKKGSE